MHHSAVIEFGAENSCFSAAVRRFALSTCLAAPVSATTRLDVFLCVCGAAGKSDEHPCVSFMRVIDQDVGNV